jgi:hypothetical protein
MPRNAFVTVERFPDAIAAELARARLESAGIGAHLADELTVSVDWQLTTAIGGIRLQVATEQSVEARAVLREKVSSTLSAETDGASVAPISDRERLAERAASSALIGLLLPPFLLYGAWLMLTVTGMPGPMRASSCRQFRFGVAIVVVWLAVLTTIVAVIAVKAAH